MTKKRFPGFEACLRMMRHRSGSVKEEGFQWLSSRAAEYVAELMHAFRRKADSGHRYWLLELIDHAKKKTDALPLLIECLHSEDEILQGWAACGLQLLNTKEARRALFDAGKGR
ncbi:MAG: HEAT repeat domain-containing protein [Phycisphaerae bacterium]|nr:HEAT repeat domain-containing protein [Phycisphaerae bacterium]